MDVDPVSLSVGLLALVAVLLESLFAARDRRRRIRQLRILAKHAKALGDIVKAQGKVVSALAEGQKEKAPAWFAEAERRRQAAESESALAVWDELDDLFKKR